MQQRWACRKAATRLLLLVEPVTVSTAPRGSASQTLAVARRATACASIPRRQFRPQLRMGSAPLWRLVVSTSNSSLQALFPTSAGHTSARRSKKQRMLEERTLLRWLTRTHHPHLRRTRHQKMVSRPPLRSKSRWRQSLQVERNSSSGGRWSMARRTGYKSSRRAHTKRRSVGRSANNGKRQWLRKWRNYLTWCLWGEM